MTAVIALQSFLQKQPQKPDLVLDLTATLNRLIERYPTGTQLDEQSHDMYRKVVAVLSEVLRCGFELTAPSRMLLNTLSALVISSVAQRPIEPASGFDEYCKIFDPDSKPERRKCLVTPPDKALFDHCTFRVPLPSRKRSYADLKQEGAVATRIEEVPIVRTHPGLVFHLCNSFFFDTSQAHFPSDIIVGPPISVV